jgi:hypothetical protein
MSGSGLVQMSEKGARLTTVSNGAARPNHTQSSAGGIWQQESISDVPGEATLDMVVALESKTEGVLPADLL